MILSGGSALINNLPAFSQGLEVEVSVVFTTNGFVVRKRFERFQEQPVYTVALGLAMWR